MTGRGRLAGSLGLVLTLLSACASAPGPAAVSPPGAWIVGLEPGAAEAFRARVGLPAESLVADGTMWRVSGAGPGTGDDPVRAWSRIPGVRWVEPDAPLTAPTDWPVPGGRPRPVGFDTGLNGPYQVLAAPPDDPLYGADPPGPGGVPRRGLPGQWGLEAMQVRQAWDRSTGQDILVAVVDTGVDLEHPDLAANLDRTRARNFLEPDQSVDDDYGHGTHVAGIIGAVTNNRAGIAGVAPGCRVLPVRVLGTEGGSTAGVVQGIDWALQKGARVINLSLGSNVSSRAEEEVIQKAIARRVVVVAASGNDALAGNAPDYPAALSGVISVAALKRELALDGSLTGKLVRADFSSFHPAVAIAAPGVDILSTMPRRFTSAEAPYGYASGTSMATPMVSGVVALMLAAHPDWGPDEVRQALMTGADDLEPAGRDLFTGAGLVRADRGW